MPTNYELIKKCEVDKYVIDDDDLEYFKTILEDAFNELRAKSYNKGRRDASKDILNFVYDEWGLVPSFEDLDMDEIERYFKEEKMLLEKYNYKTGDK